VSIWRFENGINVAIWPEKRKQKKEERIKKIEESTNLKIWT
jgi:hypothetical protein